MMTFCDYRELAQEFRHTVEIGQEYDDALDALNGQFNVADEEWREMCEEERNIEMALVVDAVKFSEIPQDDMRHMAEEMADVVVTMQVLADMLGIDLKRAYSKKMEYNLQKTMAKNQSNKVTDDVGIDKPSFNDCVGDAE